MNAAPRTGVSRSFPSDSSPQLVAISPANGRPPLRPIIRRWLIPQLSAPILDTVGLATPGFLGGECAQRGVTRRTNVAKAMSPADAGFGLLGIAQARPGG